MNIDYKQLLRTSVKTAIDAGNEIMKIYQNEDFNIKQKMDGTPLTIADNKSHETICNGLKSTDIPLLSEEGKSIPYQERKQWEYFWLIDPLDGTKEFIKRNGEFTVNIALIHENIPVMGVIYVPVLRQLFFGSDEDGAFKIENIDDISFKNISYEELCETAQTLPLNIDKEAYIVVGSRSHKSKETEDFIEKLKKEHQRVEILSKGSSLKICMVAEGRADIYPRFGPTMEWDTAAGHAILLASGGKIVQSQHTNQPLEYNKENLLNPWFIAQ